MDALIEVILPVFLVVGFGYVTAWRGWLGATAMDAVMLFSQNFAIPCLLFAAIATLDLGQSFDPALLGSFYAGSFSVFALGLFGARLLFQRAWPDCVAIGFAAMFANSVLMGLAVTERAYGAEALGPNFAIVSIHAPICYGLGFLVMALVEARGGLAATAWQVARSMARNPLMIGIGLGFLVNLSGVPMPVAVMDAVGLMAVAGLPAALFAMGGVLRQYRPEGDLVTAGYICVLSLLVHPVIVWGVGRTVGLDEGAFRSAVLTAAMAPGVNAYLFANMHGVAKRVVATAVLTGTALSVLSAAMWLALLG